MQLIFEETGCPNISIINPLHHFGLFVVKFAFTLLKNPGSQFYITQEGYRMFETYLELAGSLPHRIHSSARHEYNPVNDKECEHIL